DVRIFITPFIIILLFYILHNHPQTGSKASTTMRLTAMQASCLHAHAKHALRPIKHSMRQYTSNIPHTSSAAAEAGNAKADNIALLVRMTFAASGQCTFGLLYRDLHDMQRKRRHGPFVAAKRCRDERHSHLFRLN
ncbi:unnamed protein product, partial [Ixodes pacificus]